MALCEMRRAALLELCKVVGRLAAARVNLKGAVLVHSLPTNLQENRLTHFMDMLHVAV